MQESLYVARNEVRRLWQQGDQLLADVRGNCREISPGLEGIVSGDQSERQQANNVLVRPVLNTILVDEKTLKS